MSPRSFRNILVTGGAGFIGSNLLHLLVKKYPGSVIICLDALTYAGNPENIAPLREFHNFVFVKGDICDFELVERLLVRHDVDAIVHLAAESHVDRSIRNPLDFARTNVMGTLTLLEAARRVWEKSPAGFEGKLFYHISTDEVFGALESNPTASSAPFGEKFFTEDTPYSPHSPYSASKASSDHFVRAYHDTYGLPTIVTNCSNNYGPYQFPEKLIPLIINNVIEKRPIPVYGKGENVRDWLFVEDHARAIDIVLHQGEVGETYAIGGENEWKNIDLVREIVRITDSLLGNREGESENLITFVTDRKGHDMRYAIDSSRIRNSLGWAPEIRVEEGLRLTVKWYLDNREWLRNIVSGDYLNYYKEYYGQNDNG